MSFHCRAINFMEVIKEWSSAPVRADTREVRGGGGLGAASDTP